VFVGVASGRFLVAQGFMAFVSRLLLDMDGFASDTGCKVEVGTLKAGRHEGNSVRSKRKRNNMIGAFGNFEEASGDM
jgi:hypothetical protein